MKRYQHTQIGYLTVISLGLAVLLIISLTMTNGFNWVAFGVLIILAVCLGMFATLTVKINGETLEVRFGPGVIHRTFRLRDIEGYRVVKNPWYYGWGIRLIPGGWLYNVSGFWAVELQMKNSKRYRIGTDDAEGLAKSLEAALGLS